MKIRVLVAALAVLVAACRDNWPGPRDGGGDAAADVGADGGGDADTDADADADGPGDSGADVGNDADGRLDGEPGDADGDGAVWDGSADADLVDPCDGERCEVPPEPECHGDALWTYRAPGACDGTTGEAVCTFEHDEEACAFGCDAGACSEDPVLRTDIDIYVDNFCGMTVDPTDVTVAAGRTAVLTYHNRSVDYPVDVWLSYGGGYLDLETGHSWADRFEWCTGPSSSTGFADISTACSDFRLLIHCL